ncbi:MAG: hypothetical protein AB1637_01660 [Elusimicrobiota bacterium]
MKKIMLLIFLFKASVTFAYFDAGLNYTSGSKGYTGHDAYLLIGGNGFWVKPEYSVHDWTDLTNSKKVQKILTRVGLEKDLYVLSFLAGYNPRVYDTDVKYIGADITFSLNPTSSSKKRLAGPNSGYGGRSASGVTQIDLGAGINLSGYSDNNTDKDLLQSDYSFFAGAKILLAQLSVNYTLSKYDKNIENNSPNVARLPLKYAGMNTYFDMFPKDNLNVKLDLLGYPMITPFVSYTKTKFEESGNDDLNTYRFGAYIDLNMLSATVSYETYDLPKFKRFNFLSVSAGLRF